MGVEHLNTFQGLMSEFKRRISETLNFTAGEQMSWKLLSQGQIERGASSVRHPATHLYLHLPNLHSQLVANGHRAGGPSWNPKLGGSLRNLQMGHVTPWNTIPCLSLKEQQTQNVVGREVGFGFVSFFVKASQNFMCRERFSMTLSLLKKIFLSFWYQWQVLHFK